MSFIPKHPDSRRDPWLETGNLFLVCLRACQVIIYDLLSQMIFRIFSFLIIMAKLPI